MTLRLRHVQGLLAASGQVLFLLAVQPVASSAQEAKAPAAAVESQAVEPTAALSAEEAARDQAREAYARGEAAFVAGEFDAALAAFEEAYRAVPNPVVLRSIAHAERRMGRLEDAIAHLRAYLEAAPESDPSRPDVAAEISALSQVPAIIELRSNPAGAVVRVEGRQEQLKTPGELTLPAGDYTLVASLAGQQEARLPVTLAPGGRQELQIELEPVPPKAVVAVEASEDDSGAALWIAGGLGVAGVVTGSVLGFMALAERSKYDDNPTRASADRGERLSLFADVAFGVGATALITGAVLYFTDDEEDTKPKEAATLGVQLGLAPLPGGAYVGATARY